VGRAHAVGGRNDTAEEQPVGVIDAARKTPSPAEAEAAVDRLDLPARHVARCDQDGAVPAPDIFLRARIEQPQLPVMHADDAVDPSGGHASFGQRHLEIEENAGIEFVAAVAPGLDYAKE